MSMPLTAEVSAGPVRILVVDDEGALMKAVCDTLRAQQYEVEGFTSGKQALAALVEGRFDLLLADLTMPEMDGITLLRAALEVDPDLVAVIMTGDATIATAVEAMKSGAIDYVVKPFKMSVLQPVLSRALAVRRLRLEKAALEERVRERTAELEAANRELEAFSYSVSHDLRAPLRAINGYLGIVLEDFAAQLPAEAQRPLSLVTRNAKRMDQLISDLLRFAHTSRQPLVREPVNVTQLVAAIVEELSSQQSGREIQLDLDTLPDCVGDRGLLQQVFFNLLSNAFKFTRNTEKAVIVVGGLQDGGQSTYFVRDNGTGFDMQYAEKLFKVFARLHGAEEFEGTGIGLSIVHRVIQRHGGRIWAEAQPSVGATFHFTLPAQ